MASLKMNTNHEYTNVIIKMVRKHFYVKREKILFKMILELLLNITIRVDNIMCDMTYCHYGDFDL